MFPLTFSFPRNAFGGVQGRACVRFYSQQIGVIHRDRILFLLFFPLSQPADSSFALLILSLGFRFWKTPWVNGLQAFFPCDHLIRLSTLLFFRLCVCVGYFFGLVRMVFTSDASVSVALVNKKTYKDINIRLQTYKHGKIPFGLQHHPRAVLKRDEILIQAQNKNPESSTIHQWSTSSPRVWGVFYIWAR